MTNFNAKKVKDDLINFIKDWFEINGKDCNAIIGVSGGKDSTIVAKLCVEALGKNSVIGVLMPNGTQNDIDVSKKVIKYLDICDIEVNILNSVNGVLNEIKKTIPIKNQTMINLPPRIRMAILYAVSQSLNGRVSNNCNLSEDWIGYSTRYGDSVGDFSPLSNLTVTEVKQIGYELGIPSEFIEKVPSDGLNDEKSDEDIFGFSYEILDKYIRTNEIEDKKIKLIIDNMHEKNKFKLKLMDCFEYKGE